MASNDRYLPRSQTKRLQRSGLYNGSPVVRIRSNCSQGREGSSLIHGVVAARERYQRRQPTLRDYRSPPRGVGGEVAQGVGNAPLGFQISSICDRNERGQRPAPDDRGLEVDIGGDVAEGHRAEEAVGYVGGAQEGDQVADVNGFEEARRVLADAPR